MLGLFRQWILVVSAVRAAVAPVGLVSVAVGADLAAGGDVEVLGVESEDDVSLDGGAQVVDVDDIHVGDVPEALDSGVYGRVILAPDPDLYIGLLGGSEYRLYPGAMTQYLDGLFSALLGSDL